MVARPLRVYSPAVLCRPLRTLSALLRADGVADAALTEPVWSPVAAEQDEWDKPSASSITLRVTVLDEAQVPTVFAPQVLIDVEVPCRLAHFAAIARQFAEEPWLHFALCVCREELRW